MLCPSCREPMLEEHSSGIDGHGCATCQTHAVPLGKLRAGGVASQQLLALWRSAQEQPSPGTTCPSCQAGMVLAHSPDGLELDICKRCKILYFDPSELQALMDGRGVPSDFPSRGAALRHEDQGLRSELVKMLRADWKLFLVVLLGALFAYQVIYNGPDRARCEAACQQAGYAATRYKPYSGGGRYSTGPGDPPRCFCLTEAESQTTQGVPLGVEVKH